MLDLTLFKPEDLDFLIDDPVERGIEDAKGWAEFNAIAGPAYTGSTDGKIIAAAGIRNRRNGAGELWMILRTDAVQYKKSLLRSIITMLDILIKDGDYKYLFAPSKIGFPASQRVLEHIGFIQKRIIMQGTHYYYKRETA